MPSEVSIPNGKSGPLRRRFHGYSTLRPSRFQSQTGSQALSDAARADAAGAAIQFQSQTGSQALSDCAWLVAVSTPLLCFNPKREVRPSQTYHSDTPQLIADMFQSQTGSQALSDEITSHPLLDLWKSFNPKREVRPSQTDWQMSTSRRAKVFQSQTGSQALSDA